MTKILIVEDHALVREAMAQTLSRLEPGIDCVEAKGADDALAKLEGAADWDLAIIDLMLPDMNGFSLLAVLAKRFPDIPAIVVSAMDDEASVRRAIKGGASGFVSKASSGDTLLQAVRVVLDGGVCTPEAATQSGRRSAAPVSERFGLTAAQTRVLELLAQGKTNREIADLLGLSEGTVKVHMSAIFRALGVSNRAQALVVIARHGARL
ncbi:response regulator transcription factor [Azoarcus olearius]|uniref:Probable DNA-binding response regulator, LuxR family n=1 Tax=Azoarcus sp. (strain BH72) TaxID=418699 RepID=A1KB46_AZOSB|nr:response regulator transcription factor [Azoarcus olearius]ANQ86596.1 LuxR family DNA-binding response regulator [Azoarcus olearius]CAL96052.1 probable DNA-binding response regulator, LuxR family [Azoarcus olearius]